MRRSAKEKAELEQNAQIQILQSAIDYNQQKQKLELERQRLESLLERERYRVREEKAKEFMKDLWYGTGFKRPETTEKVKEPRLIMPK